MFAAILLYGEREHDVAEALVHRMVKRAIEMDGTATGEHGVGLVKRDYLDLELGSDTVDLMRKVRLQMCGEVSEADLLPDEASS